ncbi:MAG TPA: HNH endonuclease signature motif containing protein, partial [Candidatus Bathyarchaeia archaeon]|nr:HNH endonuclease signature motif containing protein [Candidatus Bathyarchaeia archaeon]
MHRYVWAYHHGPIPDGFSIHHIDKDKSNNSIENLESKQNSEHAISHVCENHKNNPESMLRGIRAAQQEAKKWHRSNEGREWHKKHGRGTWAGRKEEKRKCVLCGKEYLALLGTVKKGFCSPYCQSKKRKMSGVDDEKRNCIVCG